MTTIDFDARAKEIAERGYTILERVIEEDLVSSLEETLLRLERDLGIVPASNLFEGTRTVRIYNLLVHGKLFERVPLHASILPIVERVLDSDCLVSSLSSIAIDPGEQPQPIHADDQLLPIVRPHAPLVCNTMWAITDFTEENGATRIVPGSHRADRPPVVGTDDRDTIAAEMPRGSVMIYDGSLWHGGGANRSATRRTGVAMNYCAGFLRQQENQQLGIPREIARGFSARLRKLVGYGVYRGLIGHIDKKSAVTLLDDADDGFSAFSWGTARDRGGGD